MRWHLPTESAREQSVAKRLRASSKFYRFLWEIRGELFADGFEEVLIESYEPRGQEPCPPAQLAMAMLLQRYEGQSDAGAVDARSERLRRQVLGLEKAGDDDPNAEPLPVAVLRDYGIELVEVRLRRFTFPAFGGIDDRRHQKA